MTKKIIFVDIDETICFYEEGKREYALAHPSVTNINYINELYDKGHRIVYWTARGSNSGIDWYDFTKIQLDSWGCKYHKLRCDKPYYDLFIDDRTNKIEEMI